MKNRKHLKDFFRCRLAVFAEIESFNEIVSNKNYRGDTVRLKNLYGNAFKKWSKQTATVEFYMTDQIMFSFLKLSEEINTTDYRFLITELDRRCDQGVYNKELTAENIKLKVKISEQSKILENINKLLKGK